MIVEDFRAMFISMTFLSLCSIFVGFFFNELMVGLGHIF